MNRAPILGLLLASACGPGERYLARAWGPEEAAVLLIARADGSLQSELLIDGRAFEADIEASEKVYVLIYEESPELDFEECGIEIGDAHPLGRPPSRVLTADVLVDGAGLEPIDNPDLWPRPSLSYQRCDFDPFDCRNWHGTLSVGPVGLPSVNDLAILDSEAIFYVARSGGHDEEYRLVRYDGVEHHVIERALTPGLLRRLAVDGDRVWVSSEVERAAFDRLGRKVAVETATVGLNRVAGGGGARIKYGTAGLVALEGRIAPRRDSVIEAAVLSESRVMVITSSTVEHWDGADWNVILHRRAGDRWEAVGGDDDTLLAVEDSGTVMFNSVLNHEWETRDVLFGLGTNLRSGTGLGGGRFVATGKLGILGIFDGSNACLVPPAHQELRDYFKAYVTPDGLQLVVLARGIGDSTGDSAALAFFPIPQKR